jgi:hypothetical protein
VNNTWRDETMFDDAEKPERQRSERAGSLVECELFCDHHGAYAWTGEDGKVGARRPTLNNASHRLTSAALHLDRERRNTEVPAPADQAPGCVNPGAMVRTQHRDVCSKSTLKHVSSRRWSMSARERRTKKQGMSCETSPHGSPVRGRYSR